MKKILFLLAFLINALLVFSQAPIPLNRLSRSSDRFMMMMSDTNRYASYQHFNYWLSKFADSLNLQNPYWLGSILPQQSVSIGAERHNFIISNGIIGSFATDTTANGWILQSYVSGLNADGVGKIGGRNYLTGKRYGIDFDGATPTILSGNVGLSLANDQVQDSTLNNAYRYVWTVPAGNALTGVGEYVREDSIQGVWLKPQLENVGDVEINTDNSLNFENSSGRLMGLDGGNGSFGNGFYVIEPDVASTQITELGLESIGTGVNVSVIDGTSAIPVRRFISDGFDTYMYNAGSGQNSFGFYAATGGNLNAPVAIGNGKNLGEFLFNGYSNGAYRLAGGIKGNSKNVSGSTVQQDLIFFDNGGTARFTMDLTSQGNFTMSGYPNTRNDAGTAVNMLSTSASGVEESHPLAETFGAIWLQSSTGVTNTGTQSQAITGFSVDLNDNSSNYVVFGDTVVQISLTGCYTISMIAAVSSAAALNTDGWDVQMSYGGSVVPPNYVSNSPFIDLQPQYVNRSWTIKTTSSNVSVRPVFSTTIANGATTADISGVMWSIKRNY